MGSMRITNRRSVLLVQLPIPPLGPGPLRGNVPLAAAYLQLFAQRQGLDHFYEIGVFPAREANTLGDRQLVEAIAARAPWLVGFTCYLWNIERTLWLVRELKRRCPDIRIVLGGPEITGDNAWVLDTPDYDFAVIGEGEQTFANLLLALLDDPLPPVLIAGLFVPAACGGTRFQRSLAPARRSPLSDLNRINSPYLEGILDAADDEMLLLETSRGCRYRCRFCYYWKSYDATYFLSDENIRASLRHARELGAREVYLLDPTLNQRKDFPHLLRLLAEGNPDGRFTYFAELRGEGVTEETAKLLRQANFSEVEVGLQSIDPDAMGLMDRKNNLRAFERGVRAMMQEGIRVKADLIIGLPGDTVASVRRGLHYLHDGGLCDDLQVFNLSVLPGTAFREEAADLGLVYQPRPPYYVLETPTLRRADFFALMHEAQQLFAVEFDAPPPPVLDFRSDDESIWRVDLDHEESPRTPASGRCSQAFTLWLRSGHFSSRVEQAATLVSRLLEANPFTTLQIVLEPQVPIHPEVLKRELQPRHLRELIAVCQASPTYLDRYYALQPGRVNGAKRLIVVLPLPLRGKLPQEWVEVLGETATVAWQARAEEALSEEEMEACEHCWIAAAC
jgi:radical SAM superfamily enzyme YgiQ (UPF0313 family)